MPTPTQRHRPHQGRSGMRANGNSGPVPNSSGRQAAEIDRRRDHRDEAARLPFEQQQFDREQHRGDRRAEDRRHAGRRAGDQQRLAFGRA